MVFTLEELGAKPAKAEDGITFGLQTSKENRPKCSVPGCAKSAANCSNKKGVYRWRRSYWIKEQYPEADNIWCCDRCHSKNTAKRHNVKSSKHLTAKRHGITLTSYNNRNHPYLKYRKSYCENIDGRLGFKCTFTHPTPAQLEASGLDATYIGWLQVDHKDGNHLNNDYENLQTLCACCHNIKTFQNGDNATPGRKTRI
jgi:hypothetical protein